MSDQTVFAYKPNRVSPPGESLLDILDERSMTQAELAERTGRPLKTINEIVKGKTAITPETALQLERVLGVTAEFWNQREANYRNYLAREKEANSLEDQKSWIKQFPLNEMKKRRWIPDCGNNVTDQIISILNFFRVASPEQWESGWTERRLAFRKATNLNSDIGATAVWLRMGEIEAEKINCKPYNKERLLASINDIRDLTNEADPNIFIPKLREICANCGIAIVFIQPFPKVAAYGASCWLNPEKALIQLSIRGKTADILWFTIFHELCHILKHSKKELFVEIDEVKLETPEEKEADTFASETLIPSVQLIEWLSKTLISESTVVAFSKKLGIAPGILVGRLQHLKKVPHSSLGNLKVRLNGAAFLA